MKRPLIDGFFLVWRHQRLVWWIFLVNLALGFLASLGPRIVLSPILDQSFYADGLNRQFDLTVLSELLGKPEVSVSPWLAGSGAAGLIFLIYMLFLSGGVLAVFRDDRKLTRGEFFESCGDFFWRMIRLLLCSIIPFGIVLALVAKLDSVSGQMASDASSEMQGFWVQVVGLFLCLLLALFIRLWFDLAQARAVSERVRGMFVLSFRSFLLALRHLPRLLFNYFSITVIGAIVIVLVWRLSLTISHPSFGKSWMLLEVLSLAMIGLRLWQRASTMIWFDNYAELNAAPAPVPLLPLPPFEEVVVVATVPGAPGDYL